MSQEFPFKQTIFRYKNMTEAWEGVNEYLVNNEEKIKAKGGLTYGSEMVSYDNLIYIRNCRLDKNFNFGRVLGYSDKKWSKLINNYLNLDYLDLVRSEVNRRESGRKSNYNYTYHFDNAHGSGKDCLISLTFMRRKNYDKPIVKYVTRASEVTKRLAFDFLLIQRMVEYVYGHHKVDLICDIPFMFINLECFLMYLSDRGKKILKKDPKTKDYTKYQDRMLKKYKFFLTTPLEKIKYKVHQRAAAQVQRDEKGNPVAKVKDLFAKDLKIDFRIKMKDKDIAKLDEGVTIKKKKKKKK